MSVWVIWFSEDVGGHLVFAIGGLFLIIAKRDVGGSSRGAQDPKRQSNEKSIEENKTSLTCILLTGIALN
jgi:hypothetical protein